MRRIFLWIAVVCLALAGAAQAENLPTRNRTPERDRKEIPGNAGAFDMEKMQEQMQKSQQNLQKQQKEQLEQFKRMDPKTYEAQKKLMARQEQISQILSAYNQKSISADDAERRLTPLVREEVQQQTAGMDNQIWELERKLAALKKAKSNPNELVKKRVDQMLGRGGPPSSNDMAM